MNQLDLQKDIVNRFKVLDSTTAAFYVEGERQQKQTKENRFELRTNMSCERYSNEEEWTIDVCILCQTTSTNLYALQAMFDTVKSLFDNFSTSNGCYISDCKITNLDFGRISADTQAIRLGTTETTFKVRGK